MNGRWACSPFRRRPIGPFHPANKSALICVTRVGQIRLIYQNPDSKWAELPGDLKTTGYSDRLLTHAAMVATQGKSSSKVDMRPSLMTPCSWYSSCDLFCVPEDLSVSSAHHLESSAVGPESGKTAKSVPHPKLSVDSLQSGNAQQYFEREPWTGGKHRSTTTISKFRLLPHSTGNHARAD